MIRLSAVVLYAAVVARPPDDAPFGTEQAVLERRAATASIGEIRDAVMAAQNDIRSLRAVFRLRGDKDDLRYELREVIAAKGVSRYLRVRRFFENKWVQALEDYDSFYDGIHFTTYGPVQHNYEVTKRFAVEPNTEKIRGHGFWDALGWWPEDDSSPPPSYGGRTYFIRHILADPNCRVADTQELIDERWCHLVEVPGAWRLWIDVPRAVLLRRECFVGPESRLLSRCELRDYKEVSDGIELPFLMVRAIPAGGVTGIFTVDEYHVNDVSDDLFRFRPPPGTLIVDRDTDKWHQVPGGLECLDDICDQVVRWSAGPSRGQDKSLASRAHIVFGMVLAAVAGAVCVILARALLLGSLHGTDGLRKGLAAPSSFRKRVAPTVARVKARSKRGGCNPRP